MATKRTPSYRLHRASGQAVTTIDGRDVYLGVFDSPASHERYGRVIAAHKAGTPLPGRWQRQAGAQGPTIADMVIRFFDALERGGRYSKNGKPTSERALLALAARPLVKLYGSSQASAFGPLDLIAVRTELCKRTEEPKNGERNLGPVRRATVNAFVQRIVRVFRWAASMQLVPAETWQALKAVEGLRRGESNEVQESRGVRPPPIRAVARVLRHADQRVATCIRLQWWSGMRPQEVVRMRLADVDRRGAVWIYRPQGHKTEHKDRDRVVLLGPRCQRALAPFLGVAEDAFLFPTRRGTNISTHAYHQAIHAACDEAGVERWAPNQLRHAAATRARTREGLELAGILLGHAKPATTMIYAERDLRKATAFALANS